MLRGASAGARLEVASLEEEGHTVGVYQITHVNVKTQDPLTPAGDG